MRSLSLPATGITFEVIADNLDSPRGLTFGADSNTIYVAEAGHGGDKTVTLPPETPGAPPTSVSYGRSGAITAIDLDHGDVRRVITGLPSLLSSEGATGPTDVVPRGDRLLEVLLGFGGTPATRALFAAIDPRAKLFGQLVLARAHGGVVPLADLTAFEDRNDPDGNGSDSNPYGLARDHGRRLVVDAGGNDLLAVWGNQIAVVAVFPNRIVPFPTLTNPAPTFPPAGTPIPMQAVPNAVTVGPDGAYYVGQLTGFPFPVGAANVYRVDPQTKQVTTYASGFTNIISIAFDNSGRLYVLEIARNGLLSPPPIGRLVRVDKGGAQTEIAPAGLTLIAPTGVITDGDDLYVTNNSLTPGQGQVIHIQVDDHHHSGHDHHG
jgi:sugar lactone lactonase YvrE